MERIKCTYLGHGDITHELTVTMPSDFPKWTIERKQSHFTSIGRKTYGKSVVLDRVVNVKTGEVYCGE